VETILALLKEFPGARVIVVTTYDLDEDVFRAIQAGAKSYLLKDMTREQIIATIRDVHLGRYKLPPGVLGRLEERARRQELTEREMEILQLIVKGRSNKEISSALFIVEDTVKYHLKTLFSKLGVQDRTEAAISAVRHGIVHL
jgi:two-component system NarL family response regulator